MGAIPPAVRYRLADALGRLPATGAPLEGLPAERLARVLVDGEPWLGADPALADVGYWMLESRHSVELRRQGCVWLSMFPSPDTARRLAAVARDATTPEPVREQAIWALGDRELRGRHRSTLWTSEAIEIADEALWMIAEDTAKTGKLASMQLPHALRHVQATALAAVFARSPGLWADALECFATPPLARVLLVSLDDVPPQHRIRTLRLVAATLGAEALPLLVSRPTGSLEERIEIALLAVAIGGEPQLPVLESVLRELRLVDLYRARAKWHLANPGVIPTVRGLRVARTTATIAPAERAAACGRAADDLGVLSRFARHDEAYLYTLWGWMVRGAGDPARARELVAAHPESQRLVGELYLQDLARRGRIQQLAIAAQALAAADVGALQLAIWGRPFAALELAASARLHTAELVCARALACYRAGRADLTERVLVEDLPPAEVAGDEPARFPGPHEQWLIDHAADTAPAAVALARGKAGVLALAQPAPHDAEADTPSLAPIAAVERRLGRALRGATVYLAGEFTTLDARSIRIALEKAGARLVGGPFPGTDYYVHGDTCAVQTIAQLERQGTRRLRPEEIEAR